MRSRCLLFLCLATLQVARSQFDYTQCGQSKGCLFMPSNCDPSQGQCVGSFSYMVDGTTMVMEIQRTNNSPNGYFAVGFSNDQQMGDDSVNSCSQATGPQLSYNQGKNNIPVQANGVLTTEQVTLQNGVLYCRFRRQVQPNGGNPQVYPLDRSYYILMAYGDMNGNNLAYHGQNRLAQPSATNIQLFRTPGSPTPSPDANSGLLNSGGGRSTTDKLLIAHGILMVLAWTIFLSTGVLFARYFRGAWQERKLGGLLLWFHFHRTLNMIGIGATIAGFVLIFVAKGWIWVGPRAFQSKEVNQGWGSIHAILGLLACVVAWAQPLNAVFRCGHDSKLRFIFNMIHRFFGVGALLMAFAATMIAVVHFDSMFSKRDAALGLYIAFIAVYGLSVILLELLFLRACCVNRRRVSAEMEMTYMGGASYSTTPGSREDRLWALRYVVLLLHLVVAIGTAIAICVLIGKKPKA